MLNLGRNSRKFVSRGFIRLRAYVSDEKVHLSVEDSGIGIPADKSENIFAKFQESLDLLAQGTVGYKFVEKLDLNDLIPLLTQGAVLLFRALVCTYAKIWLTSWAEIFTSTKLI